MLDILVTEILSPLADIYMNALPFVVVIGTLGSIGAIAAKLTHRI